MIGSARDHGQLQREFFDLEPTLILAQFASGPPIEIIVVPGVATFWLITITVLTRFMPRSSRLAWFGLIFGAIAMEGGILLMRWTLVSGQPLLRMRLWGTAWLTVFPAATLLAIAWHSLRIPRDSAAERSWSVWKPIPGLRPYAVTVIVVTCIQFLLGMRDIEKWKNDSRTQALQNQVYWNSVNVKKNLADSRFSIGYPRREISFYDHGSKCYAWTSSKAVALDLHAGRELHRIDLPPGNMWSSFACSNDGQIRAAFVSAKDHQRLVLISDSGEIQREVHRTNRPGFSFPDLFAIPSLPERGTRAWGEHVVAVDGDHINELALWDLELGTVLARFRLWAERGYAPSEDLGTLAVFHRDYTTGGVQWIDAHNGAVLYQAKLSFPPAVINRRIPAAIDSSTRRFACASEIFLFVCEFDEQGMLHEKRRLTTAVDVVEMKFSPDGQRLAVYGPKHGIEIFQLTDELTTRVPIKVELNDEYRIPIFAPDLKTLVVSDGDAILRYSVSTGKELFREVSVE